MSLVQLSKYTAVILLFSLSTFANDIDEIHIRVNQVGYSNEKPKSAFILSNDDLKGERFEIIDDYNQKTVRSDFVGSSSGEYAKFEYLFKINFSDFKSSGTYRIKIKGVYSHKFKIGKDLFTSIPKKLIKFFGVQRCGYTNPTTHEPCHRSDVSYLIDGGDTLHQQHDVSGGWHDAGDYIKFLNTTAYATYTMLFSYEFNKEYFEFDKNSNNVPDILEEAKVGLDWLLRSYKDEGGLISQVQDLRDHTVGWRMPDKDTLQFDRPGFVGIGKNTIGIYTATLALASKIWKERFNSLEFADECLTKAENIFSYRNSVVDIDSSTSAYLDNSFKGKLALGAIELYRINQQEDYLELSKKLASEEGVNYWWSYSEITDFTFYRLSEYDSSFAEYIQKSLLHFENIMHENQFDSGAEFYWGSNHTILGIALKSILYKEITNSKRFYELAASQIDYILGKNPWGLSFIGSVGSKYSRDFHHQVSYLTKRRLPGGFAAGPVKKEILDSYNIEYDHKDKYSAFQTDEAVYRDDRMDYVTNEPTIIANATGMFVFANL